jgi:hypothetical protein
VALSSISITVNNQQQIQGLRRYLVLHSSEVTSLDVRYAGTDELSWCALPKGLKLKNLQLAGFNLELSDNGDWDNTDSLSEGPSLTQLCLRECNMETLGSLYSALSNLPSLQHLKLVSIGTYEEDVPHDWDCGSFWPPVLKDLQNLTFLEVGSMELGYRDSLKPLRHLTNLKSLRLDLCRPRGCSITASMLSSMQQLTHLDVAASLKLSSRGARLDFAALTHLPQLQHLRAWVGEMSYTLSETGDVAAAFLVLQRLKQLTHLSIMFRGRHPVSAADHAYSALTTSTQLQYLKVSAEDSMRKETWSQFLPAGRQLPHLRVLLETARYDSTNSPLGCADVSRLVSACPALRQLSVGGDCSQQQLEPVSRLTGLRQLAVGVADHLPDDSRPGGWCKRNQPVAEMAALAQLTTLHGLTLFTSCGLDYLLALTHLQQLGCIVVRDYHPDRLKVGGLVAVDTSW